MPDSQAGDDASAPVTVIRNIGPAQAEALAAAGIHTAGQLRDLGADAAYRKLLSSGSRPHFIMYYVLHMALQGRPWNDCRGEEKAALRKSFDSLKASAKPAPPADGLPTELSEALEKEALRASFDAICAEMAGHVNDTGLERILDEIGTGKRR